MFFTQFVSAQQGDSGMHLPTAIPASALPHPNPPSQPQPPQKPPPTVTQTAGTQATTQYCGQTWSGTLKAQVQWKDGDNTWNTDESGSFAFTIEDNNQIAGNRGTGTSTIQVSGNCKGSTTIPLTFNVNVSVNNSVNPPILDISFARMGTNNDWISASCTYSDFPQLIPTTGYLLGNSDVRMPLADGATAIIPTNNNGQSHVTIHSNGQSCSSSSLTPSNQKTVSSPAVSISRPSTSTSNTSDVSTSGTSIPPWIKKNAQWWSQGQVSDSDFVKGIQYLIQQGIMTIPNTQASSSSSQQIPAWVKTNAGWWANGQISNNDFVKGIQYLINNGIITLR